MQILQKDFVVPKISNFKWHLKGYSSSANLRTCPCVSDYQTVGFETSQNVQWNKLCLPVPTNKKTGVAKILHSRGGVECWTHHSKQHGWTLQDFVPLEVTERMICLKLYSATRKRREVLVANCQFFLDRKIVTRTLGLLEVKSQPDSD